MAVAVREREEWMRYLEEGWVDAGDEGRERSRMKVVPLSGTGEVGEVGTALPFTCLPQAGSLPVHCSAPCHRADPANPIAQISSPALFQVGSANGEHWPEVGGQGDGRSQRIFPRPPPSALCLGSRSRAGGRCALSGCPTRQPLPLGCQLLPGSCGNTTSFFAPQPSSGVGVVSSAVTLGCLTIPSGLLFIFF